jgi:hypothetical protein
MKVEDLVIGDDEREILCLDFRGDELGVEFSKILDTGD